MSLLTNSVFYSIIFYIGKRGEMMKCQNCGFESAEKICSVCGVEIIETKEENTQKKQIILPDCEERAETSETEKPKRNIRKILLFILIVILSAAFVSASSVAIFHYCTNDSTTRFNKINQTVNCGDYSIKLKEVKIPKITLEYYPQIVYDIVFEFHNNTGGTLTLERPMIKGILSYEGGEDGFINNYDGFCYNDSDEEIYSDSIDIPAWSSVDIVFKFYYEDYSDPLSSSYVYDVESEDANDNSDESDENDENDETDEINIDESRIKFKREGIQKLIEDSPESFYMVISDKKYDSDEEDRYARFFVELDKDVIEIPTGDNIE